MCRRSPLIPSAKRARTPAGNTADSSGGNSVMSAPPECFLACNYRLFTGERRFAHAQPQPLRTAHSVSHKLGKGERDIDDDPGIIDENSLGERRRAITRQSSATKH